VCLSAAMSPTRQRLVVARDQIQDCGAEQQVIPAGRCRLSNAISRPNLSFRPSQPVRAQIRQLFRPHRT
jgi:hypothetical protein